MLGHGGDSGLCRLWLSAVVKLRPREFQHDETSCVLRFQKAGKSREIPVGHDLEQDIKNPLENAGIGTETNDAPLFWASDGRTKKLTGGR